jgi:hypothetical protein
VVDEKKVEVEGGVMEETGERALDSCEEDHRCKQTEGCQILGTGSLRSAVVNHKIAGAVRVGKGFGRKQEDELQETRVGCTCFQPANNDDICSLCSIACKRRA